MVRVASATSDDIRMVTIVVQDMTTATMQIGHTNLTLAASVTVKTLLEHVAASTNYMVGTFQLVLQPGSDKTAVVLNERQSETLESVGFACDDGLTRNNVMIANSQAGPPERDSPMCVQEATAANAPERRGFVGLVNQAMTCYLNSLIQTLFMTPEFRNAMYRWRFDGNEEEQAKSIPFQLQTLFLKLQTTDKSSIGTTNLTRSFGWDSSEAWQQHDIQELCRVMFDALEHKFKNTEQADLISRLYEGKMMDYVRCLECRTEKAREDTFLDIPLPVRPFGSQTAYASIEEALKAFVAPETLDGNNQYLCDKCGKKCDAHKGLKFSRFPYLLTLHLKRFDFDYNTLHRIKLNDKVTFPEFLYLDSFLECNDKEDTAIEDSMSEASESSRANSSNDPESQDDDEGIDVRTDSTSDSTRRPRGHYNYELFSIMIHSGSATGGHYYAYVKDFLTRQWYCFNDQIVSSITYDDIRKTYGGGPARSAGYFASAYTSSTNAYMLMYRQIDKRNANFMSAEEFPDHIKQLLQRMKVEEESQRAVEEEEKNTCKIQLYCHHPKRGRIELQLKLHKDLTLRQAIAKAYLEIGDLGEIGVSRDRCRLVKYNELYDNIECSWDQRSDESVEEIFDGVKTSYKFDLLLEIVPEGQHFQVYAPGTLGVKVLLANVQSMELNGPIPVRMPFGSTVRDLKQSIRTAMNFAEDANQIFLANIRYSGELHRIVQDDRSLRAEGFQRQEKVYALIASDENEFLKCKDRFYELIDQYENAVTVRISLPRADKETLDRLGIDSSVVSDAPGSPMESFEDAASDDSLSHLERERALSEGEEEEEENKRRRQEDIEAFAASASQFQEEYSDDVPRRLPTSASSASASEDSSLSLTDSDRTLLGDPPETEEADNISPVAHRRNALTENEFAEPEPRKIKYLFKVTSNTEDSEGPHCIATVDKRIPLSEFKSELGSMLSVASEFLLVYKKSLSTSYGASEREWLQPQETLETLGDDPRVIVRLGRSLRPGEIRGKIFQLNLNDPKEMSKLMFEWIFSPGQQMGKLKLDILAEMKSRYNVDVPLEKCILRKKNWRTPSTVYGDDEVLDTETMSMFKNWEMFIQILNFSDPEDVADKYRGAETVIFTRRWRPSAFALDDLVDTPLFEFKRSELGKILSQKSGVPFEQIEIAKVSGTFPCEPSLFGVHESWTWVPVVTGDDDDGAFKYPCNVQTDGEVVFWRDKSESLKKLSDQERREIERREGTDASNSYSNVSQPSRKERPLRILLDSPRTSTTELELD